METEHRTQETLECIEAGKILYGKFTEQDMIFAAFMPGNDQQPQVWTLVVERSGEIIRNENIAMDHAPIFGPDIDDVRALNKRVDELVAELTTS